MIDGRLKKFYQESVLLEQTYVIDGESKISSVLQSLGSPVEIIEFVRYELGEGIEKASDEDFASVNKIGMWSMEFDYPWDWRKKN